MTLVLLVGTVLFLGVLVGFGLGGSLRNLADVRIRLWPALIVALVVQAVPVPRTEGELGSMLPFGALLLSYVILIVVVIVNWKLRGFALVLLGLMLNVIPIVVNRGMPVSGEAVVRVGGSIDDVPRGRGQKHHLATEEDRLLLLTDVIAVQPPFRTVVSVGDFVMYFGAAMFLAAAMVGRWRKSVGDEPPDQPPGPAPPSSTWGSPR